jgi:phosphatidylglycerol:prolipoprotein diacylglycerol transferase
MAIVAPIIHGFGRLGCFFAGCCYGVPTDSILGVVFTDEISQAKPLHTALHPTQLYEFVLISSILLVLVQLKRKQKFEGQLFFVYIILYATGRSITEMFRGDLRRGFIIEDLLSHSQFISIVLIIITILAYRRFSRKRRISS